MWKRTVEHTFVHAAVQLTTSLAERVWSINGDGAPFRSHKTSFAQDRNMDRKISKNAWCRATFSAKLVLHSKAAKTTCCWKCCYHQQNQAKIFLARGVKFQHFGRDFCVEIFNLLQEMLLSEFVAGNSISSNMMFLQLLNAQQALQKELHNTKCFSQHFHPEAMYSLHAAI